MKIPLGPFKHFIPDRCISRSQCGEDLSPEDSNVDNMSIATDNPDIDIEMSAIPAGPAPAGELAPHQHQLNPPLHKLTIAHTSL